MHSIRISLGLALVLINSYGMCTYNSQDVYNANLNYPVYNVGSSQQYTAPPRGNETSKPTYSSSAPILPVQPPSPTYQPKNTYSIGGNQGQYNVQSGYPVGPAYVVGQPSYPNTPVVPNKTYASTHQSTSQGSKLSYFTEGLRQPTTSQQSVLYPHGNTVFPYSVQKPPTILQLDPYSINQPQPPALQSLSNNYNQQQMNNDESTTPSSGFWKFLQFFTLPKFEWPTHTTSTAAPPTDIKYGNNRYPAAPVYTYNPAPPQQSYSSINPNYYQPTYQPYPLSIPQTVSYPSAYNYLQTSIQPTRQPQGLYQVLPPNSKIKYAQQPAPLPMRFTYPVAPVNPYYPQQPPKSYSYTNLPSTSNPQYPQTTTTTTTSTPPTQYPSPTAKLNYPQPASAQTTYSLYLVPAKSYESQQPTNSFVQNYNNPAPIASPNQQSYSIYGQPQQYSNSKQPFQPLYRPQQTPFIQANTPYEYGYQPQPFYGPSPLTHLPPYYPAYIITPASSTPASDCGNSTVNHTTSETTTASPAPVVTHKPPTTGVYVAYQSTTSNPVTSASSTTSTTTSTTASPLSRLYTSATSTTATTDNATSSTVAYQPQARRLVASSGGWTPLLSID